jgi:hypothetical protein
MDTEDKCSQIRKLLNDVTEYVNIRFNALKLQGIDHLSNLFGVIFITIVCIFLLALALLFLMAGVAIWMEQYIGSLTGALFLVGGFFVVLAVLVVLCRKQFIINRMVRIFVRMFFGNQHIDENNL